MQQIDSKLPDAGTSIFAIMSKMAADHGAINLSQGFPDFEVSPELISLVNHYIQKGLNQYAPMPGVYELRKKISEKTFEQYGAVYDADTEVNITAGATQAIFAIISAFIRTGDEVIIFEPAYDSYVPAVQLNGGIIRQSTLSAPDFSIKWDELEAMINPKTRMIIINSPHNPTGSILQEEDLKKMEKMIRGREIILLSDEVYEHLIFDGMKHQSICKFPELARQSFAVGSFGKTFHATGWKMGYVLAPDYLMQEFRKAHQFIVFACNTPVQYALADFLSDSKNYLHVAGMYESKRDYFTGQLKKSRFRIVPSHGTYFQLLDYSEITTEADMDFAARLVRDHGIAAIPLSPFYYDKTDPKMLRFCFAKKEGTLKEAADILCRI